MDAINVCLSINLCHYCFLDLCIKFDSFFVTFVVINTQIDSMRKIIPELTEEISKLTSPETVAKDEAIEVSNYRELRKHIAQLSYANKDCILFYRGQKEDYKNVKSGKSTFYPTLYRGERLDKHELKYRWEKLNIASEIFTKKLKSKYPSKTYIVKRKRIVQWSILQHYEVTETPLIDVTQSLKVACSFAVLDNNNAYAYVYVFALPYYTNRISVNSEHYLTNVRLLSVAPPQALRPYYQEGFLIGEDEFSETYTNKDELDLNNRLVAKFKFKNDNVFWGKTEGALTKDELYPQDDEIEALCKEVSIELFNVLANKRNVEISGDYYLSFMDKWIDIEKLLFEYLGHNNSKYLTPAGLIKKIADSNLRIRLNRARAQRNFLAHNNVKKDICTKELLGKKELEELYSDLQRYFQLHNQQT